MPFTPNEGADAIASLPYADATMVMLRDRGRTYTATSKPSISDLDDFLTKTAAELDAVLRARGHVVPVPNSATEARILLAEYNTRGAHALALAAAPTDGGKAADAMRLYNQAKKMLALGEVQLDAPMLPAEARPRHGRSSTSRFLPDSEC